MIVLYCLASFSIGLAVGAWVQSRGALKLAESALAAMDQVRDISLVNRDMARASGHLSAAADNVVQYFEGELVDELYDAVLEMDEVMGFKESKDN